MVLFLTYLIEIILLTVSTFQFGKKCLHLKKLTGYSTAGCITYVELDSGIKNNLQALETIVNYAMDKDIPYFAINVPVDECQDCGYTDDMNDICITCGGSHVTHLRRVTG